MSPVKRICVFEHSVMTNFNCACPAIQRGQGSGFLSEGSSWLTAYMSEQQRFWRDCADAWIFAARIGDKYQIRLTRSKCSNTAHGELNTILSHILYAIYKYWIKNDMCPWILSTGFSFNWDIGYAFMRKQKRTTCWRNSFVNGLKLNSRNMNKEAATIALY